MNMFQDTKNKRKRLKNCYNHNAVERRTQYVILVQNVKGDVKNI